MHLYGRGVEEARRGEPLQLGGGEAREGGEGGVGVRHTLYTLVEVEVEVDGGGGVEGGGVGGVVVVQVEEVLEVEMVN